VFKKLEALPSTIRGDLFLALINPRDVWRAKASSFSSLREPS